MSKIIQDDDSIKIEVLNQSDDKEVKTNNGDTVTITAANVEKIKSIVYCEEQIKFYRETITGLKKTLAEDIHTDGSFVSELIGIIKKEMDPDNTSNVIDRKTQILEVAEQVVVMYPNVALKKPNEVQMNS